MTELLNLLFDAEVFKEDEYREAMDKASELPIVPAILSLGYGSEEDVYKIAKNKLKIPVVSEEELQSISKDILNVLPKDIIVRRGCLPFFYDGHHLKVAMFDPTDNELIGELSFFTDSMILAFTTLPSVLGRYINKYYDTKYPEEFVYGINQHLKDKFSREVMFTREVSQETKTVPSPPNIKASIPKPTQNVVEKPDIPRNTTIKLPGEELIEDRSLSLKTILEAGDKNMLFSAVDKELVKLSIGTVLLFVRGSFLQVVSSAIPLKEKLTVNLEENSVFRDVLESQKIYTGPPYLNAVMKNFLNVLGTKTPANIVVVPLVYQEMVFAELYSDNIEKLSELLQLRDAITKTFVKLLGV